jgi:hypothetical protein
VKRGKRKGPRLLRIPVFRLAIAEEGPFLLRASVSSRAC